MKPSDLTRVQLPAVLLLLVSLSIGVLACTQAAPPAPTAAPKAASPQPAATASPQPAPASAQPAAAPAPAKKVDFPSAGKTITLIAPYAAGGAIDTMSRTLAPLLEKELGVPVQVLNRAGAGGQIGTSELARSKPDGYTFGFMGLPDMVTYVLDPERQVDFKRSSFQPLAMHVVDPNVMAVRADSPYQTAKDLFDAAKAKPGTIKASTTGVMGDDHLALLLAEKAAGARFATVHFDGDSTATPALLGKHTDVAVSNVGQFFSHLKAGTVRIIGIMDKEESRFMPGVKTFEAQGYKLYHAMNRGWAVPAGVPTDIMDVWVKALAKAIQSREHKDKMESMGYNVRYMSPDQFNALWTEMESTIPPLMELTKK